MVKEKNTRNCVILSSKVLKIRNYWENILVFCDLGFLQQVKVSVVVLYVVANVAKKLIR
jgi:hypothetical protein